MQTITRCRTYLKHIKNDKFPWQSAEALANWLSISHFFQTSAQTKWHSDLDTSLQNYVVLWRGRQLMQLMTYSFRVWGPHFIRLKCFSMECLGAQRNPPRCLPHSQEITAKAPQRHTMTYNDATMLHASEVHFLSIKRPGKTGIQMKE